MYTVRMFIREPGGGIGGPCEGKSCGGEGSLKTFFLLTERAKSWKETGEVAKMKTGNGEGLKHRAARSPQGLGNDCPVGPEIDGSKKAPQIPAAKKGNPEEAGRRKLNEGWTCGEIGSAFL